MYSEKQLNYLRILQQQKKSGKITKKQYKKEVSFTKNLNQSKKAVFS